MKTLTQRCSLKKVAVLFVSMLLFTSMAYAQTTQTRRVTLRTVNIYSGVSAAQPCSDLSLRISFNAAEMESDPAKRFITVTDSDNILLGDEPPDVNELKDAFGNTKTCGRIEFIGSGGKRYSFNLLLDWDSQMKNYTSFKIVN